MPKSRLKLHNTERLGNRFSSSASMCDCGCCKYVVTINGNRKSLDVLAFAYVDFVQFNSSFDKHCKSLLTFD